MSRLIDLQSSVNSQVNILVCAKVFGDWYTVKVLAHLTVVDGSDVEEKQKSDKEKHYTGQTDNYENQLSPSVVDPAEGDERQQGVGQQEAENEAE